MTFEELTKRALAIYDEYQPQRETDDDLYVFVSEFLRKHYNDFLLLLPSANVPRPLVCFETNVPVFSINYEGGRIKVSDLSRPFLKLLSIKASKWERMLHSEDVIDEKHPRRKLQENKFTSGKTSRPVVSVENYEGEKSICFWSLDDLSTISNLTYLCRVEHEEDFLTMADYLLEAYIYYTLFFVFTTTSDIQLAQNSISMMQQLLSLHNIYPAMPTEFNQTAKK